MHQLLSLKIKLSLVGGLLLLFLISPNVFGVKNSLGFGATVAIVELALVFLSTKSWGPICRLPRFLRPKWAINLNGEWSGEIISLWKALPTDQPLPSIPAQIKIRQDWGKFSIELITASIRSKSSGAFLEFDAEIEELSIKYFYETDPFAMSRGTNPPQLGSAFARISVDQPNQIFIRYINDRGVGGEIRMQR